MQLAVPQSRTRGGSTKHAYSNADPSSDLQFFAEFTPRTRPASYRSFCFPKQVDHISCITEEFRKIHSTMGRQIPNAQTSVAHQSPLLDESDWSNLSRPTNRPTWCEHRGHGNNDDVRTKRSL